jgi:prepilin-type N-terminal cleavage/methylation domain-containing protein/prepilin-type processing-associated H-X9-DG protein
MADLIEGCKEFGVLRRRAFTLVELLIVVAIIAVVLAVLLPSLRHVKELGKRVRCATNLRSIGTAIKLYADYFDGALPNLESNIGTPKERLDHPYWICRDFVSGVEPRQWKTIFGFGCLSLTNTRLIETPLLFYCPADDLWREIYRAYATPYGWGAAKSTPDDPRYSQADNPNNAQDIIRVTYVYYPETRWVINAGRLAYLGGAGTGSTYEENCPEIALKAADLDPSKAMSADNGGHALGGTTKATDNPEINKGHNVLFGDGHVNFQRAPTRVIGNMSVVTHIRQEGEGAKPENSVPYFMSRMQP